MKRLQAVIDRPRAPRPPRSARAFLEEFSAEDVAVEMDVLEEQRAPKDGRSAYPT